MRSCLVIIIACMLTAIIVTGDTVGLLDNVSENLPLRLKVVRFCGSNFS